MGIFHMMHISFWKQASSVSFLDSRESTSMSVLSSSDFFSLSVAMRAVHSPLPAALLGHIVDFFSFHSFSLLYYSSTLWSASLAVSRSSVKGSTLSLFSQNNFLNLQTFLQQSEA